MTRVIFYVRCHGEPDEELEQTIMDKLADAVEHPEMGWGILTIGRQYFHDDIPEWQCHGCADPRICTHHSVREGR